MLNILGGPSDSSEIKDDAEPTIVSKHTLSPWKRFYIASLYVLKLYH